MKPRKFANEGFMFAIQYEMIRKRVGSSRTIGVSDKAFDAK